jgi:hypothetical protein
MKCQLNVWIKLFIIFSEYIWGAMIWNGVHKGGKKNILVTLAILGCAFMFLIGFLIVLGVIE